MSKAFSPIALHPTRGIAAFAEPRSRPWGFERGGIETEIGHAFDAIRECARIAWWDGSAIGLHLHSFFGLFDTIESVSDLRQEDLR